MRRKKDRSNGITALYERLSRDDDNAGESNSIVHQKQMLEDYAMKHGFTNLVHFTDDGWSGAGRSRSDDRAGGHHRSAGRQNRKRLRQDDDCRCGTAVHESAG